MWRRRRRRCAANRLEPLRQRTIIELRQRVERAHRAVVTTKTGATEANAVAADTVRAARRGAALDLCAVDASESGVAETLTEPALATLIACARSAGARRRDRGGAAPPAPARVTEALPERACAMRRAAVGAHLKPQRHLAAVAATKPRDAHARAADADPTIGARRTPAAETARARDTVCARIAGEVNVAPTLPVFTSAVSAAAVGARRRQGAVVAAPAGLAETLAEAADAATGAVAEALLHSLRLAPLSSPARIARALPQQALAVPSARTAANTAAAAPLAGAVRQKCTQRIVVPLARDALKAGLAEASGVGAEAATGAVVGAARPFCAIGADVARCTEAAAEAAETMPAAP